MIPELQKISLTTITGRPCSLAEYRGAVLLIVNVASQCGLTPQYEALESLYDRYQYLGLDILGFPSNDFAGQEPGTDAEIQDFCRTQFDVSFPMFSKISVVGDNRHPLYSALITAVPKARSTPGSSFRQTLMNYDARYAPEPEVLWNFEKFLVGRDGRVIDRFAPDVRPDDPMIIEAIERALYATL